MAQRLHFIETVSIWAISRSTAIIAHPISIAGAAVATSLLVNEKREHAIRFGVALPLGVAIAKVVKRVFPRHKPRFLTVTPHESMPSGHSAATAAFSLALIDARRAWRWTPLAIGAVAFVNACRVHDREHRVSEVLIGDAIGLGAAVVAGVVARRVLAHRRDAAAPEARGASGGARAGSPPR